MNVKIDGKMETVPYCTCGKCIVKRIRKGHFTSFPYSKNLGSIYTKDYLWNDPEKVDPNKIYNKAKHNGFEGCYREHIPTMLMSTQKMDYKPFKVYPEDFDIKENKIESIPFYGRSTYKTHYPSWGSTKEDKSDLFEKLPDIKVPLRGSSNYKENYIRYDPNVYSKGNTLIKPLSTLEFFGKLNPDTTFKTSYVPIDLNQPHYFDKNHSNKANNERTSFIPAKFPKSNFESNYKTSYHDYNTMCKLRVYLNERGMKNLEI